MRQRNGPPPAQRPAREAGGKNDDAFLAWPTLLHGRPGNGKNPDPRSLPPLWDTVFAGPVRPAAFWGKANYCDGAAKSPGSIRNNLPNEIGLEYKLPLARHKRKPACSVQTEESPYGVPATFFPAGSRDRRMGVLFLIYHSLNACGRSARSPTSPGCAC